MPVKRKPTTGPGVLVKARDGRAWRGWLRKNHRTAKEAWLVFHKKESGRAGISYNDAVDEALCFGWIDSVVKKVDETRRAQRFTPRRPGSPVSELNQARVRRLIAEKRMTKAGLDAIGGPPPPLKAPRLAPDVRAALEADPAVWRNYRRFPVAYKRIRIGFIEAARDRPAIFGERLAHFVRRTKRNETYGMLLG